MIWLIKRSEEKENETKEKSQKHPSKIKKTPKQQQTNNKKPLVWQYGTQQFFSLEENIDQQNIFIQIIETRISHWTSYFFQLPHPNLRCCGL